MTTLLSVVQFVGFESSRGLGSKRLSLGTNRLGTKYPWGSMGTKRLDTRQVLHPVCRIALFMLLPYLAMHRGNRKRKVATVTPPDRKGLKTPSPKRTRQTGVDFPDDKVDHELKFVSKSSVLCLEIFYRKF